MLYNFYPSFELIFASWTLYAYDYVLGFEGEIDCIWFTPWGWGKVAYIWTRLITIGFIISSAAVRYCETCSLFSESLELAYINFTIANTVTGMLVFVSCQEILMMRVCVLYFRRKVFVAGLTALYAALFTAIIVVILRQGPIDIERIWPLELYMFNIMGLIIDSVLFVVMFTRAIRLQSMFSFRGTSDARERILDLLSASVGRVPGAPQSLLSLIVSESVIYYLTMMLMYTVTFVAYRLKPEDVVFQNGLVTFMTIMMGIMVPKMLLNIRKEFYYSGGPRSSETPTHGTITWQVADPSHQDAEVGVKS